MKIKKIETNYKFSKLLKEIEIDGFVERFDKQENNLIMIYPEIKYQAILGFGGAITESAGYVFSKFSDEIKEKFVNDYFSEEGIGYSFARLHINSCDFSLSTYAYSEKEDLSDFSIENDKKYIIPLINTAKSKNQNIKILSSPWSPPKFMKTNNNMCQGGKLKEEYKSLWSEYICNYIKEYKKQNINIDYLTVQNEPNAKQIWESCLYSTDEEVDFALNYLIPKLEDSNLNPKVLVWDHNKERLYLRAKEIFSKDKQNKIAGIGYHYYTGDHFENIELVSKEYPEKLLIHTEGCTGFSIKRKSRQIPNAEIYAHDIIGDLNSGANAYIDWNILLDSMGGPNHVFNYCNSPVMSNLFGNKYIKNASYYYIGHFSKYIKRGAKRIAFSKFTDKLEMSAFQNYDNTIVIVIMNRTENKESFSLVLNDKCYKDKIEKHSIITYII